MSPNRDDVGGADALTFPTEWLDELACDSSGRRRLGRRPAAQIPAQVVPSEPRAAVDRDPMPACVKLVLVSVAVWLLSVVSFSAAISVGSVDLGFMAMFVLWPASIVMMAIGAFGMFRRTERGSQVTVGQIVGVMLERRSRRSRRHW